MIPQIENTKGLNTFHLRYPKIVFFEEAAEVFDDVFVGTLLQHAYFFDGLLEPAVRRDRLYSME